jgi:hypothetical protein
MERGLQVTPICNKQAALRVDDYGMNQWVTGPSFGVRISFTRERNPYIKPALSKNISFCLYLIELFYLKRKIYDWQNKERIFAFIYINQSDLKTLQTACVIH